MKIVATILAIGLATGSASASDPLMVDPETVFTGNDLLARCENDAAADQLFCAATIHSSTQAFGLGIAVANGAQLFCVPRGVTLQQQKDIVVQWLRSHPAERHDEAAHLIPVALAGAFPCPK